MTVLDDIKQLGHFLITIRPTKPLVGDERPDHAELERVLRKSAVLLRGWDFPHIDTHQQIRRSAGYISQESKWRDHWESWRFFRSGQFASRSAFIEDVAQTRNEWPYSRIPPNYQPGERYISVTEVAYRCAEATHLARSLARSLNTANTEVSVRLENTQNRTLFVADPMRFQFHTAYQADDAMVEATLTEGTSELGDKSWESAAQLARELFGLFGWDPEPDLILRILEPIRRS